MSGPRPCVLVLCGGPGAEHEVSLASGRAVAEALRESRSLAVREQVIGRVTAGELAGMAPRGEVAAIFPVLHGRWGEGGPLQQILERHGLPYVGSGPRAAALAMNKPAAKTMLAAESVATPRACLLREGDRCELDPPLVLKPVDEGSSVDLRVCRTAEEVARARTALHPRRGPLLAERYVAGRELTVGILAGEALPLIEIVPAVEFYDYAAKYDRDDTGYVLDPVVDREVARRCREAAILAYRRLGCRDLARVDFMLDERGPWFLEINTMPGFTGHSLLPMAARARGIEMPALCTALVRAALSRTARKPATV